MTRSLAGMRGAAFAALSTVFALSLSAPAHAAVATDLEAATPKITLVVMAAAGSGCDAGTVVATPNTDFTGFRIRYTDDFVASGGPGVATSESRKNCQYGVLVTVPEGLTFAIAEANYRGRAKLASGATGLQKTTYYWQGSSENHTSEETFTGPYNGTWATRDIAPVLVYSPCGGSHVLNVNTELRVNDGASTSKSTLSVKASDLDADTLFNVTWASC